MNTRMKASLRCLVIASLAVFFLLGVYGSSVTLAKWVDIDRLVLPEGEVYKPSRIIMMAETEIHEIGFDLLTYLKTLDLSYYYDNLMEQMDDFEMCIKGYEEAVTDPEDKRNIAQVKQIYLELKPLVLEIVHLGQRYSHLERRFNRAVNKLDDLIDERVEFDLYCRPYDPELKKMVGVVNLIECEVQQFAWRLTFFLETGDKNDKEMADDNFKQLESFVDEVMKFATSIQEKKFAYAAETMVLELKKISGDLVTKKSELREKLGLFKSKMDSIDEIIDQDIQKDTHR